MENPTREELYQHARRCGLSPKKAARWTEDQLKPKPPPDRFKASKEHTMMLFEPSQLASTYRG